MKKTKALKWIALNPMEIISATALSLTIIMAVVNAITRYVFSWTWNPTTDLTTLLFGWMVFCGSAAAYKRKMHYGIDLVVSKLHGRTKNIVSVIAHAITLLILVVATILSWQLSVKAKGKLMPNTAIPYFWFDFSAVVGFFYMAIYEAKQFIDDIKAMFSKNSEEEEEK